jgi:hypothetical protein
MRIIEIKAYQYNELSEKARERARAWYRQESANDLFDADCVIDDWKEKLEAYGFSAPQISYSGFSYQGDGALFTTGYCDMGKLLKAIEPFTEDSLLRNARRIAGSLEVIILRRSHRYTHKHNCEVDIDIRALRSSHSRIDQVLEALKDKIEKFRLNLCTEIYNSLENEWNYQNSDEVIEDNIIANSHEFTQDGKAI